jgi:hypothetical protein
LGIGQISELELRPQKDDLAAWCDIATAARMSGEAYPLNLRNAQSIAGSSAHHQALDTLKHFPPFHFPVAFPEVFLEKRKGFDVIVGNPPWEEAMCDVNEFWGRYIPGYRGLPQTRCEVLLPEFRRQRPDLEQLYQEQRRRAEVLRRVLANGPFPGMETGHPDLYKAFCWRFWQLLSEENGWLGVVLPRSALNAKGSTPFRLALLTQADPLDITILVNNRKWVFPDVHPQYSIGLLAARRGRQGKGVVHLRGPFSSRERFVQGLTQPPRTFAAAEVLHWTDTASLPLLSSEESLDVFAQLRRAPRLDCDDGHSWRVRPVQGDLNATFDKGWLDFTAVHCSQDSWPVFKGESFDLWHPDSGKYYAWAEAAPLLDELRGRRHRAGLNKRSAYSELERACLHACYPLPCQQARIAFRDITRATDSRTVRAALLPPRVFVTNKAPYLLWPRGSEADQAYLLGILCSLPLDWYARRFVETALNFFLFKPLPIPRPMANDRRRKRVIQLAGRLAAPDERFAPWAEAVGVDCGPLPAEEKQDYIQELDAVAAHLYGLEEKHLIHIFETFHQGWDYEERLKATLKHFQTWRRRSG